jgi:hypothetical protein
LITLNSIPRIERLRRAKIDNYNRPSDGVYYPDDLTFSMGWKGGGFEIDQQSDDFFFKSIF